MGVCSEVTGDLFLPTGHFWRYYGCLWGLGYGHVGPGGPYGPDLLLLLADRILFGIGSLLGLEGFWLGSKGFISIGVGPRDSG